jgi:hypothetical protein
MGSKREHNGQFEGQLTNLRNVPMFVDGGEIGAQKREDAHESGADPTPAAKLQKEVDLHVCMGLNACKGHDVTGKAKMAGMGECATVFHICHGANECRGQGGCGYTGSDAEQARPGAQSCRWNGSCASPINESRVHAAGPYRGTSVWKRARKLFEHRMFEAGIAFGPSPGEGYPDKKVPPYEGKRGVEEHTAK